MNSSFDANNDVTHSRDAYANEIFRNYSKRLLQLAMEQLAAEVQCKISPEDVVQSALKSFFRRAETFSTTQLETDTLWGLLSIITIRKCRKWEAFFRCSKRNVRREELALDDSSLPKSEIPLEPGGADALVATELIDLLLKHFTERQQEMILLRTQGLPVKRIAIECQSSKRTVARTISKAKTVLAGILFDSDD
jgi:RNA polymerase sigma-70 factor, ECF subfamily